jgi:hypothetical protein
MKTERLEALVWESLDGTITAEARVDLEQHIERHPGARELQLEIEKLAEQLDGLGRAAPPETLRPRITAALQEAPAPTGETQPVSSFVPPVTSRQRSVAWLPLAACLLVGIAVGYLLRPGAGVSVDQSRAAGAMISTAPEAANHALEIDLGERAGTMLVGPLAGGAAISVELVSATDLEIVLEVADGMLLLTGIDTVVSAGFEVTAVAGRTVIRTHGPAVHELKFTTTEITEPVHLVVRSNGAVVADNWLHAGENRS